MMPGRLGARLRHPQTTVRWRLTLLYGGLFLICGAALLAVTYALVAHAAVGNGPRALFAIYRPAGVRPLTRAGNVQVRVPPGDLPPGFTGVLRSSAGRAAVSFVGNQQRISDLHQLEVESAIALAIMAIISALLGWIVAGRVLRPLRTITATAQQISEANLHERLSLPGPRDELRTLADTIDGLLGRLERAFDAQRRFVTNASHELRTPLAASRALLEMAISDPHATVDSFRAACKGALEEGEQQEQLIDALLALAQGERGLEGREPVDLASITREVQLVCEPEAAAEGLELDVEIEPAEVLGDRRLVAGLVSNLVQIAIRHNVPHGRVSVCVENRTAGAVLIVANTGPAVATEEIPRLLQPFQRVAQDRVGHHDGFGLGLSIVAAVAAAHDAALEIVPGDAGGLRVELRFPPTGEAEAIAGQSDFLAAVDGSVPEPL
jgi:signal transduction histidine kinase